SPDRCEAPEAHSRSGRPEDAGAAFPQDHEISPAGEGRSQQAASASPTCPIRRQGGKAHSPGSDGYCQSLPHRAALACEPKPGSEGGERMSPDDYDDFDDVYDDED